MGKTTEVNLVDAANITEHYVRFNLLHFDQVLYQGLDEVAMRSKDYPSFSHVLLRENPKLFKKNLFE